MNNIQAIVFLPCFVYATYYAISKSNINSLNAFTLITSLNLSIYAFTQLVIGLLTWNYTSIVYVCVDIALLAYGTNIFTDLNQEQEDFINDNGTYILCTLLFITLVCFDSKYNIKLIPNLANMIYLGLFVHFFYCIYDKTRDVIFSFTLGLLLLIPYYFVETLTLTTINYIYDLCLTHIIHSQYALLGIVSISLLMLYIRLYVLEGKAHLHIHLIVCAFGGIFYYSLFLITYYLFANIL